jgi:hypothetical protein
MELDARQAAAGPHPVGVRSLGQAMGHGPAVIEAHSLSD